MQKNDNFILPLAFFQIKILPKIYPDKNMTEHINTTNYVFKIELQGITPKIWRRVKIDPSTSLDEFHFIIQVAMDWEDRHYHLHKFFHDGKEYFNDPDLCHPDELYSMMSYGRWLDTMGLNVGDQLLYEYDLESSWMHTITFEEVVDKEDDESLPMLMAGEYACPPDNDIGGCSGYAKMMKLLKTKDECFYNELECVSLGYDLEFDANNYDLELKSKYFSDDVDSMSYSYTYK